MEKKVNRQVQGVPQSQTAAILRHQEEEKKKDKNIHSQNKNKKLSEKHKDQLPLPQVRWSECLNKWRNEEKESEKTLKH